MTQEDKQLLIKDLCTRLPYGVRVKIFDKDILLVENNEKGTLDSKKTISDDNFVIKCDKNSWIISYDGFKPYLRPMSSMTQEENLKLDDLEFEMAHLKFTTYAHECMILDYLYSRHLDVRGLIPMGLALEAPKDMYKIE